MTAPETVQVATSVLQDVWEATTQLGQLCALIADSRESDTMLHDGLRAAGRLALSIAADVDGLWS